MPAPPQWHQRLPAIRAELAALDSPTLDRALVEELFGLSRRQAIRLMAALETPRPGVSRWSWRAIRCCNLLFSL